MYTMYTKTFIWGRCSDAKTGVQPDGIAKRQEVRHHGVPLPLRRQLLREKFTMAVFTIGILI